MNGIPASSLRAWRGAGKTCTYTCPGPLSLYGYLHPACLATEGRIRELSKEDGTVLDTVVSDRDHHNSPEVLLSVRYTSFLNTRKCFPFRLCSLAGERICRALAWRQASLARVSVLSVLPSLHEQECVLLQLFHYRIALSSFYFIKKLENEKIKL